MHIYTFTKDLVSRNMTLRRPWQNFTNYSIVIAIFDCLVTDFNYSSEIYLNHSISVSNITDCGP